EEYPYRLEYGTPNLVGIAGLYAGVNWILNQGLENIHQREMDLLRKLRDGLREIEGVTLYCQDSLENHIAVLLFNVDGLEATETATLLDVDYNIACRAGLQCAPLVHEQLGTAQINGGVRFSLGPFNTEEQIEIAINAVQEIADFARKKKKKQIL
ncbi:MAG: aminotransferase class V-fold PLP-dependent enzyme, partial [Candidatus Aminicenantes bacterium]|nr:aminotransferase class V-fold PLP-dependent enzyme [Candidatus Aminicenantes bacterium]